MVILYTEADTVNSGWVTSKENQTGCSSGRDGLNVQATNGLGTYIRVLNTILGPPAHGWVRIG